MLTRLLAPKGSSRKQRRPKERPLLLSKRLRLLLKLRLSPPQRPRPKRQLPKRLLLRRRRALLSRLSLRPPLPARPRVARTKPLPKISVVAVEAVVADAVTTTEEVAAAATIEAVETTVDPARTTTASWLRRARSLSLAVATSEAAEVREEIIGVVAATDVAPTGTAAEEVADPRLRAEKVAPPSKNNSLQPQQEQLRQARTDKVKCE